MDGVALDADEAGTAAKGGDKASVFNLATALARNLSSINEWTTV
jgi:hypothetical protein